MIAPLYRPLIIGLLPIALIACMSSGPTVADEAAAVPLGVDLGGSGPVAASPQSQAPTGTALAAEGPASHPQQISEMQMAHEGQPHAQGTGTVNSVDASGHKINLTHGPIPALGWPGMTMDFAVTPAVDLSTLKPGTRVNFTIEKGDGGTYEIQSVKPAGGGR
jgi:Cu(I)/Ag(I) efflux system protein CusF